MIGNAVTHTLGEVKSLLTSPSIRVHVTRQPVATACGLLEPSASQEALADRLVALAGTLGAVQRESAGTGPGAGTLAGVLVKDVMRPARRRLSLTNALTRVLIQVAPRPAARRPRIFPAHALTRLLVQLLIWATEVLLQ